MDDYSLVPVEHQPDFDDVSLVPVDHDPFSDDGVTQQAQSQPAQIPPGSQAQRAPTDNNSEADAAAMSPETYVNPFVQRILGNLATSLKTIPQRAFEASAADVQHLGDHSYTPQSIGPAVETALTMLGPGSLMAERGAVGAVGGKLPAVRAAEKGHLGIGTTPNGGPTLVGTDHLYPAGPGQRSVVSIKLTGSRRADEKLANTESGFTKTPTGYMWHHVDDFDPKAGTSSLELVTNGAHQATIPHAGSVAQYGKFHGVRYKR